MTSIRRFGGYEAFLDINSKYADGIDVGSVHRVLSEPASASRTEE